MQSYYAQLTHPAVPRWVPLNAHSWVSVYTHIFNTYNTYMPYMLIRQYMKPIPVHATVHVDAYIMLV